MCIPILSPGFSPRHGVKTPEKKHFTLPMGKTKDCTTVRVLTQVASDSYAGTATKYYRKKVFSQSYYDPLIKLIPITIV